MLTSHGPSAREARFVRTQSKIHRWMAMFRGTKRSEFRFASSGTSSLSTSGIVMIEFDVVTLNDRPADGSSTTATGNNLS